jgi:hypothetical protein
MSDSWEAFAQSLREEVTTLVEIERRSGMLTEALVGNVPARIEVCRSALDEARKLHAAAFGRRRGMQQRGFGKLPLQTVLRYAPPSLALEFNQRISELTTYATAVQITNSNNKALIMAGMERLMKTVVLLQEHAAQNTRTYRRHGQTPRADTSVIVSKKA